MATALLHFSAASAASTPLYTTSIFPRGLPSSAARVHCPPPFVRRRGRASMMAKAYKVTIEHEGEARTVEVEEDETILGRVLEEGLAVPHDCKLGVCMTCPARLVSGTVDQSDGMLSDDVIEKGYALLCASYPRSDCHISTIPEEELLSLQLATAND
ncbi:ferredoxin C 1, chloroplastic-like [Zingiber officinale]|uniref:ferredoxin C 1, chloroplastic-like n=1 Tax=Zingiber officinale TaxID=94328 RepID=UPI001C4B940E|nr:ferredoxin C 1, chloroplastic-like [Zingiber officinale]